MTRFTMVKLAINAGGWPEPFDASFSSQYQHGVNKFPCVPFTASNHVRIIVFLRDDEDGSLVFLRSLFPLLTAFDTLIPK